MLQYILVIMGVNFLAPFVPTPMPVVKEMLKHAQISEGECLVDIGAGDGRVVIHAAQEYGVKCIGVEINEKLYKSAVMNVAEAGLSAVVDVVHKDVFEVDLRSADIVVMYLTTVANEKLRPKLENELKRTTRVITHDFSVPTWEPTETFKIWENIRNHHIFLYEMKMQKQTG